MDWLRGVWKRVTDQWAALHDPMSAGVPLPGLSYEAQIAAQANTLRRECVARSEDTGARLNAMRDHLEDIARDTFSTVTKALKGMEERMNGLEDQVAELSAKHDATAMAGEKGAKKE